MTGIIETWNGHPWWFQLLGVGGLLTTIYMLIRYGVPLRPIFGD